MSLIVDASVAVKWLIDETGSDAARELLQEPLSSPDVVLVEVFSAVAKRARRREVLPAQLEAAIPTVRNVIANLVASSALVDRGAQIARQFDHTIYDCLYIALAQDLGDTLVTADERQFMVARRARVRARML